MNVMNSHEHVVICAISNTVFAFRNIPVKKKSKNIGFRQNDFQLDA